MKNDEFYINECLSLAREAEKNNDVPVGAVVVKNGEIIGRGFNRRALDKTSTSHAEIEAIAQACKRLGDWRLDGCTLYVTLEPCPMCAGAAYMARIPRIVYGASEPSYGALGSLCDLKKSANWDLEVQCGVKSGECAGLLSSFFEKMRGREVPKRLKREFYSEPCETVAQNLLGKIICVKDKTSGKVKRARITETEAYLGEGDTASHASKGKTDRNKPMFDKGGTVYVYLCYGMHSMLNLVTGQRGKAEAVLIRGVLGADGPGRVTKFFGIDKKFNESDVVLSDEIWVEDDGYICSEFEKKPRVGIDYAEEKDRNALLRFIEKNK